jgi:hypothetical protein
MATCSLPSSGRKSEISWAEGCSWLHRGTSLGRQQNSCKNSGRHAEGYSEAARGHHPDGLYRMALYYRDHDGLGLATTYLEDAESQGHTLAGATYREWQVEGLIDFEDDKEAVGLLEWGVTLGMDIARHRLAERLREGRGIKENTLRAAKLYEEAAKNGHAPSMYEVARCYQTSCGFLRDSTLALEWMKKAADANDPNGLWGFGVMYQKSGRQQEALDCFRRAAEFNHPAALKALADAAGRGEGTPADEAESHRLIAKAAENGDAEAQFRLGELYSAGAPGFEQDSKRAQEWYERAADQDYAPALRRLGEMRLARKKLSKDETERARIYIERAAKLGDVASMLQAAAMLERSRDPERDYLSLYWYRQAAELGNAGAQFEAGKRLLSVSFEREIARRYLEAAASQGNAEARTLLDESGPSRKPPAVRLTHCWLRQSAATRHRSSRMQCGTTSAKASTELRAQLLLGANSEEIETSAGR